MKEKSKEVLKERRSNISIIGMNPWRSDTKGTDQNKSQKLQFKKVFLKLKKKRFETTYWKMYLRISIQDSIPVKLGD